MRFYFPDSQDLISPSYDFMRDEYHPLRIRQRDDRYAHEVLTPAPYDGVLVSKAVVDGTASGAGKYSEPQRQRLYRYGVHEFFRLPDSMRSMGDCGAFNYVAEPEPPYSVKDVADFYEHCGFDEGVSVDHVILGYAPQADASSVNPEWRVRQRITLELAATFLDEVNSRGTPFEPLGAAQGWSPESYAASVTRLQEIGYKRIAMGGMVPLKTRDILDVLRAVSSILNPDTQLHLLGVTRVDTMHEFARLGATSFDSTTAMRQAFMDDRHNYHTAGSAYTAVRIPQVDGNPRLKRAILSGDVPQQEALKLERSALKAVREYGAHRVGLKDTLEAVVAYEQLVTGGKKNYVAMYRDTLSDRPWEACDCTICDDLGIEVVVFRGTERNKRRGFHNLHVLNQKVRGLALATSGS